MLFKVVAVASFFATFAAGYVIPAEALSSRSLGVADGGADDLFMRDENDRVVPAGRNQPEHVYTNDHITAAVAAATAEHAKHAGMTDDQKKLHPSSISGTTTTLTLLLRSLVITVQDPSPTKNRVDSQSCWSTPFPIPLIRRQWVLRGLLWLRRATARSNMLAWFPMINQEEQTIRASRTISRSPGRDLEARSKALIDCSTLVAFCL